MLPAIVPSLPPSLLTACSGTAPKKKEVQKLSYGEFMTSDCRFLCASLRSLIRLTFCAAFGGSWADEVEETYGGSSLSPPPFEMPCALTYCRIRYASCSLDYMVA